MPWSGSPGSKTFTRSNGTYTGTQVWAQDSAANTKITSFNHDSHDQDLATGINTCLTKDGSNSATADLPMGGNKLTNVGVAVALSQYARMDQVQNGAGIYVPTVGGTANAITLTTGWTMAAYAAGQTFRFIAAFTNSDAVTVNVDGVGAKNIKVGTTALSAGQIQASSMITITYDGTQFQIVLQAASPAAIAVGAVMAWPMTTVPAGFLECDGSAISRSTYSALFAVFGTAYGVGDGSSTFNLPNYKDYFLRGFDSAGTDAGSRTDRGDGTTGAAVGTKQADQTRAHTHGPGTLATDSQGAHTHFAWANENGGDPTPAINLTASNYATASGFSGATDRQYAMDGTATAATVGLTSSNGAHTHSVTSGLTASTGGTETRPANITVKWIVLALPGAALAVGTGFTRSPRLVHSGGIPARVSTDGNDSTPVNTEVYIAEIFVPGPGSVTVTGVAVMNGSVASGNLKVGLADCNGNIVATSVSTAMSGTDAYQRVAFTASYSAVGPATYYVLLFIDNGTARYNTHTFGNFGASKQTGQVYATGFTTISPPSTFTANLGPIASLY